MTQKVPFSKSVSISKHAIDRAVERLNQPKHCAENHIRQLLSAATFHGEGSNEYGKVDIYLHRKTGVSIVVSQKDNTVVTLYCPDEQKMPKLTVSRITNAIKRELERMTTQYKREIRKLHEQQAVINVRIAELSLNKIRCYHPPTKALIQSRIDEYLTQINELAREIDGKMAQIEKAETEVKAVVGE